MTGQPLYEFGGSGPLMHLALANGFPPQTYRPLLDPFTARYRVVSLPPRGFWPDPPPTHTARSWRVLARDLLAGMDQYGLHEVILVGHSFGGIASMLAALEQPGRFRALILLDPTMLPPNMLRDIQMARWFGRMLRQPLVQGALRRRSHFASRDDAFAYWREKPLFKDWSDETLWLYTESMTRPTEDGFELSWPPEWEAHYYRTIFTASWRILPRLRGLLPVLALRGTTTNTFLDDSARKFRQLLPDADLIDIPGHGHLFPQSAPEQTRQIMDDWLREKGF